LGRIRNRIEERSAQKALASGLRVIVSCMGPRQRREVARLLSLEATQHTGVGARLLLRLAVFIRP